MNIIDYENRIYFSLEPTEIEKKRILQEEYEKELKEEQERLEQYGYDDCI